MRKLLIVSIPLLVIAAWKLDAMETSEQMNKKKPIKSLEKMKEKVEKCKNATEDTGDLINKLADEYSVDPEVLSKFMHKRYEDDKDGSNPSSHLTDHMTNLKKNSPALYEEIKRKILFKQAGLKVSEQQDNLEVEHVNLKRILITVLNNETLQLKSVIGTRNIALIVAVITTIAPTVMLLIKYYQGRND